MLVAWLWGSSQLFPCWVFCSVFSILHAHFALVVNGIHFHFLGQQYCIIVDGGCQGRCRGMEAVVGNILMVSCIVLIENGWVTVPESTSLWGNEQVYSVEPKTFLKDVSIQVGWWFPENSSTLRYTALLGISSTKPQMPSITHSWEFRELVAGGMPACFFKISISCILRASNMDTLSLLCILALLADWLFCETGLQKINVTTSPVIIVDRYAVACKTMSRSISQDRVLLLSSVLGSSTLHISLVADIKDRRSVIPMFPTYKSNQCCIF